MEELSSWVVETETVGLTTLDIFITWLFTQKFANLWCEEWAGGTKKVIGKKWGDIVVVHIGDAVRLGWERGGQKWDRSEKD